MKPALALFPLRHTAIAAALCLGLAGNAFAGLAFETEILPDGRPVGPLPGATRPTPVLMPKRSEIERPVRVSVIPFESMNIELGRTTKMLLPSTARAAEPAPGSDLARPVAAYATAPDTMADVAFIGDNLGKTILDSTLQINFTGSAERLLSKIAALIGYTTVMRPSRTVVRIDGQGTVRELLSDLGDRVGTLDLIMDPKTKTLQFTKKDHS